MITDKFREKKYIIMALILMPVMIIGSLLVNFNIMDAFYLLLIVSFIICYVKKWVANYTRKWYNFFGDIYVYRYTLSFI